MSRYNRAFSETVGDLKKRISEVNSKRLRKPAQDPVHGGEHEEPDGDEDEYGNEPPGPEETRRYGHGLKAAELGEEEGSPDDKMEGLEASESKMKSPSKDDDSNCNSCGGPGESDDKFCRHCGTSKR
jgi:hypothetical protein